MKIIVGTILAALCVQPLLALDFSADYPPIPTPLSTNKGFFAGLAEQGTYFNTTQLNGHSATGPFNTPAPLGEQHLTSITSEPFFGYNFCDRLGLQLDLPVIYREYQTLLPGMQSQCFRGFTTASSAWATSVCPAILPWSK